MPLAVHSVGDGPNLALVHGWGFGSAALATLAAQLGQHFTVNLVDLPGYGDSDPLPGQDIADIADELAALLPPRSMLCGWSLGALVCLACAARHPRLVARMVLVATTPSFVQREGWSEALPVARLDEFETELKRSKAQWLKQFATLIHQGDRHQREAARSMRVKHAAATDAGLFDSLKLLAESDLRPLLDRISQPALLVHGDADPLIPLAAAERLWSMLPEARLEVFGGSAHAPFASDPARFVDSVRRFAGMTE